MNKTIYIGTTDKCSACKCQETLTKTLLEERPDIELRVCNYDELPHWLQVNVILTDFPITILTEDETIRYHFVGTKSIRRMKTLFKDINF